MPEGDTVYQLARRLERALDGATVVKSDFRVPKLATADLTGRTILEHLTHGKHLVTRFSGEVSLHSHLRMDGRWSITESGKQLPRSFYPKIRLILGADNGQTAWGIKLHDLALVRTPHEAKLLGHLGPDPLRADWDASEAIRRLQAHPGSPIVSTLLDQTLIAGLGNLWVNELAFVTGVSPWTPMGELDITRLVNRSAAALKHSATVPRAYQVTTGRTQRGEDHWVFGRRGFPCLRCGAAIQMAPEVPNDPANRRTWWCPGCQPGPGPEARVLTRR